MGAITRRAAVLLAHDPTLCAATTSATLVRSRSPFSSAGARGHHAHARLEVHLRAHVGHWLRLKKCTARRAPRPGAPGKLPYETYFSTPNPRETSSLREDGDFPSAAR
jgi:hypothetical protein